MAVFEPKRILCPVDFSEHSALALRVAGGLGRAFAAELVVLHAQRLEAPVYFTISQVQAIEKELRNSAEAARVYLADFARKHLSEDIRRSFSLVEEDPVAAIARVARVSDADLIVMGTHGRTGVAKVRLGSVMESVLRQITKPVLTVGPAITLTPSLGVIRRILCPVNYDSLSALSLEHATIVAARTGAALVVMNIVEDSTMKEPLDKARRVLCDWVDPKARETCSVNEVVQRGNSAEQIIEEAKSSGADLIVIGARPRESLGELIFGSTTEAVIRRAPCPVLSVVWGDRSPNRD